MWSEYRQREDNERVLGEETRYASGWRDGTGRDVSRFVSRRKSCIQCDITDSAVARETRGRRDERASCVRMRVGRESTPATVDTQRRSAVSRVKARSDRPRQYLHNDSTAAVHCGARALRDAPHRCGRRAGPIVARPTCTLHIPRCIDASFTDWSRGVFRGFRASCPRPHFGRRCEIYAGARHSDYDSIQEKGLLFKLKEALIKIIFLKDALTLTSILRIILYEISTRVVIKS